MHRIRSTTLISLSVCLVGAASVAMVLHESSRNAQASLVPSAAPILFSPVGQEPPEVPVTGDLLRTTMIRLGLHPEALAAAGVVVPEVAEVVVDARGMLIEAAGPLGARDQEVRALVREIDDLQRRIQAGTPMEEDVSQLVSKRAALNDAQSAVQDLLDAIHQASVSSLTNHQQLALANLRANQAWEVPAPYLVIQQSEKRWVSLRTALAHERVALAAGDEVSPAVQAFLLEARAEEPVALGLSTTAQHLEAITAAWDSAIGM